MDVPATATSADGADVVPAPPRRWIDRFLERAYERLGWKIYPLHLAAAWLVGLLFSFVGPLVFRVFEHLDADQTERLIELFLLTWIISLTTVTGISTLLCQPLRRHERGGPGASADQAWVAAVRMPRSLIVSVLPAAMLIGVPGAVLAVTSVGAVNGPVLVLVGIGSICGPLLLVTVAMTSLPLATRPVLRSLAAEVDPEAIGERGVPLRYVLLFAAPTIAVTTAILSASFTFQPGEARPTALEHLGLATLIAAVVFIPSSFVLAHLVLQPVGDLLEAAERLKRGDYLEPVPRTTMDEFGVVAHSFNEAMSGLSERTRLAAENEQLLQDVMASRTRIVTASYEARRRVERDIHDGAQQRLLTLALELARLEEQAAAISGTDAITAGLVHAGQATRDVLEELRELARGVHPVVLTTDGLPAALEQLASLSQIPVTVSVVERRYPEAVESTAYFVVAESLTNVIKHAHATHAWVEVVERNDDLVVTVDDDGRGGASLDKGSGLTGLQDRTAALGGALVVTNGPDRGTRVSAVIPLRPDL